MAVTLTGTKALDIVFRDLAPTEARKAVRKGAREGAKIVQQSAKAKVPKDTGALRRSIRVRALKRTRTGKLGARVITGEGFFKGEEYYGGFVEYGTVRMQARPFLRPAMDENHTPVLRAFITSMKKSLHDLAGRAKAMRRRHERLERKQREGG